jgi:hypothetical protein
VFGKGKKWLMIFLFVKSVCLIGITITVRLNSPFSHVAMLDGPYFVIEAQGGVGVVRTPLHEFLARYTEVEYRQAEGSLIPAREDIGRQYDKWGAIGLFFFNSDWQHPEKRHCGQLAARCMTHHVDELANQATPKSLYPFTKPYKGEIK